MVAAMVQPPPGAMHTSEMELEDDRLVAAVSWLHSAVCALRVEGSALGGRIVALESAVPASITSAPIAEQSGIATVVPVNAAVIENRSEEQTPQLGLLANDLESFKVRQKEALEQLDEKLRHICGILESQGIADAAKVEKSVSQEGATAASQPQDMASDIFSKQLLELHRMHSETHHALLECNRRLNGMEETVGTDLREASADKVHSAVTERFEQLELKLKESHGDLDFVQNRFSQSEKQAKDQVNSLQRNLVALARFAVGSVEMVDGVLSYIATSPRMGEASQSGSGSRLRLGSSDSDSALAGVGCLEARLTHMEKVAGEMNLEVRLDLLERGVAAMDVKLLHRMQIDIIDHRRESGMLEDILRSDMKEVKVLVGCLEACVPRETRKAIELFKRSAGVAGFDSHIPNSPRAFEVHGKILSLQDDMDVRITGAETKLDDSCERVLKIAHDLEVRQARIESRLGMVEEKQSSVAPSRGCTPQVEEFAATLSC